MKMKLPWFMYVLWGLGIAFWGFVLYLAYRLVMHITG